MKRKSFILYTDSLEVINELDDSQIANLFRAIYAYAKGEPTELSKLEKIAFLPIKQYMDRDGDSYQKIVERNRENGKRGGRPKKTEDEEENPENPVGYLETQETQPNPKNLDNDNVNDTENENDTKNEINTFSLEIDTEVTPEEAGKPPRIVVGNFEEFYKLYPNKKARGSAEKAYSKAAKHHEAIMEGLKTEIEYRKWAEGKNKVAKTNSEKIFVPAWKHPATWLNQECWKDEYTDGFRKEQERIRRNEAERKIEKEAEDRKKLDNLFEVTRAGYFNKKYPEGWSVFEMPEFMRAKNPNKKILTPEDNQEFAEYFKKLYPKEAEIIFSEINQ